MAMKDLTPMETMVYEYVKASDFSSVPWITSSEARKLGTTEEELYKTLAELTKKIKDNFWIYYEAGSIHIVAE